jgi:hypothetical protein
VPAMVEVVQHLALRMAPTTVAAFAFKQSCSDDQPTGIARRAVHSKPAAPKRSSAQCRCASRTRGTSSGCIPTRLSANRSVRVQDAGRVAAQFEAVEHDALRDLSIAFDTTMNHDGPFDDLKKLRYDPTTFKESHVPTKIKKRRKEFGKVCRYRAHKTIRPACTLAETDHARRAPTRASTGPVMGRRLPLVSVLQRCRSAALPQPSREGTDSPGAARWGAVDVDEGSGRAEPRRRKS